MCPIFEQCKNLILQLTFYRVVAKTPRFDIILSYCIFELALIFDKMKIPILLTYSSTLYTAVQKDGRNKRAMRLPISRTLNLCSDATILSC